MSPQTARCRGRGSEPQRHLRSGASSRRLRASRHLLPTEDKTKGSSRLLQSLWTVSVISHFIAPSWGDHVLRTPNAIVKVLNVVARAPKAVLTKTESIPYAKHLRIKCPANQRNQTTTVELEDPSPRRYGLQYLLVLTEEASDPDPAGRSIAARLYCQFSLGAPCSVAVIGYSLLFFW